VTTRMTFYFIEHGSRISRPADRACFPSSSPWLRDKQTGKRRDGTTQKRTWVRVVSEEIVKSKKKIQSDDLAVAACVRKVVPVVSI